jgi:hypothetical protein
MSASYEQHMREVHGGMGPEEMPYGLTEFAVKDPNGYLLSFGQPIE